MKIKEERMKNQKMRKKIMNLHQNGLQILFRTFRMNMSIQIQTRKRFVSLLRRKLNKWYQIASIIGIFGQSAKMRFVKKNKKIIKKNNIYINEPTSYPRENIP